MKSKIFNSFLGILLTFGMLPVAPVAVLATGDSVEIEAVEAEESDISEDDIIPEDVEVDVEDQEVISTSDMMHFIMDVRWGNVRGDAEIRDEANFDGSVSVPSPGRVSLRELLRFENHDKLTGKKDPVAWDSLIYGSWDGVRVLVSAQAGDMVTVETAQGTYSDLAQTIFKSEEPIVKDLGNGYEIVIKARKMESRTFFFAVAWGSALRNTDAGTINAVLSEPVVLKRPRGINFSGSAEVAGGTKMKPISPLRFERLQGDKIIEHDKTHVKWRSVITRGVDGVLIRLHPDRTKDAMDKMTIRFDALDFEMDFPVIDLIHKDTTIVDVPVAGHDAKYELIIKRWRQPNRKLIRAKNSSRVYVIEGDLKRHVVSADAFGRSGLKWEDVEVVDDEDDDAYVEGEPFGYDDGMLIKGSGLKVWVLTEGKRRHVSDPAAFARLGYNWDNLIVIPDADVEQYEEEDELAGTAQAPEGALLRVEGDPKVYRIEGGRRKHVPNPDVFEAQRLRWDHVQVVGADVVSELPVGDDLNYPNGAVVEAPDGRIFEIINGKRQHLKSAKELLLRGHTWQSVRKDETGELINGFEDGDDLELLDDVPTL